MKVSVRKKNNKKVIAKKPLTNLYEMNSSNVNKRITRMVYSTIYTYIFYTYNTI